MILFYFTDYLTMKHAGKSSRKRRAQLQAARASKKITPQAFETTPASLLSCPSTSIATNPETPTPPSDCNSATLPVQSHSNVMSASKRKLSYEYCSTTGDESTPPDTPDRKLPCTICSVDCLSPLIEATLCPHCFQQTLTLTVDNNRNCGLAICLVVYCKNCQTEVKSVFTSEKCDTHVFDVNRRAVATACATGMGWAGLANFSEFMNIPILHQRTFTDHVKKINCQASQFSRDSMASAVREVKRAYSDQQEEIKNIHVSFDGSWHKRGHTSNSGIGCVIERKTGLVIDCEVLTRYCHVCETVGKRLQAQNILRYERWLACHRAEGKCHANYEGPSGGMEKEAALRMWGRSVVQHGLRYVSMISDGDAKTISEIHKLDPYPGYSVQKHECVNHVSKRLGTALRNIVKLKGQEKPKVTLGGKGFGKLRPEVITQLQRYYTKAIRSNPTVPKMQTAIMAIIEHCSSTDDDPHHSNCPKGPDSWCFFQKHAALGLPVIPGSHLKEIGTPLAPVVAQHILPIFQNMSSEDLLSRCTLQATQNANECVHSVIWARCPKHLYVARPRLNIAVALGCAEFNFGSSASQKFLEFLNLGIGLETKKRGKKRDHTRQMKAAAAITLKAKKHRLLKSVAKEKQELALKEKFGVFYEAGGGD